MRPLGPAAPPWARRLYRRSIRVLVALTDPRSGAMIAGERDGWDYVWPRDAGAGALALEAAGLRPEAQRVAGVPRPARPGRARASIPTEIASPDDLRLGMRRAGPGRTARRIWRDRQDYGENVTGDLLGNAIAAGVPASEIQRRFLTPRGLVREQGGDELDSSAAWAATVFPQPGLRRSRRRTLLTIARESTPYGIPPIEGWTPGEVWTAPTAWSAWALVELGETRRPPTGCSPSSIGPRRRTGPCPSGSMRGRASRPRPRRSPGRTPSRSWRCGRAIR